MIINRIQTRSEQLGSAIPPFKQMDHSNFSMRRTPLLALALAGSLLLTTSAHAGVPNHLKPRVQESPRLNEGPATEKAAIIGLLSPPVVATLTFGGYVALRQSGQTFELPTIDNPFARTKNPPPPKPPTTKYAKYVLATGAAGLVGREVYAFHANRTPDRNGRPVQARREDRGKIILVTYDQESGIRQDRLCGSLTAVSGLGLAVTHSALAGGGSLNCTRVWTGMHVTPAVFQSPQFYVRGRSVRPIAAGTPQTLPASRR